jgi:pretoxin HINT domain-containing protein
VKIAKLQIGDPVISYQSSTGQMRVRRVTKRVDHAPTQIWEVNIQGTAIPVSTTECHPFLTRRGWVFASRLKPGDELISIGRSGHQCVASACRTDRVEPVHNLFTTGEHTFVVQGYVVHNFAYLRNLRSWWHRLFVDWKVESMKTRNRTQEHPAHFVTGSS